ncbi:MAG: ATP-binding protein [Chthoniobacterales bacterium]
MNLATILRRQPPPLILAEGLTLMVFIGAIDVLTGYQVSLSILYVAPIYIVAWRLDRKLGLLMSLLCGIVWWWANVLGGRPFLNYWQEAWETTACIGFFVFVALEAASLRRARDASAARIALLEHSQRLEREIVEISESERRRIGQDLHDGICQYLAAVGCAAASLQTDLLGKGLQVEATAAEELSILLKEGVVQARALARGLVPVQMVEAGLVSALEELAASVSRLHQVDCRLISADAPSFAPGDSANQLYRIAQEAIANAVRHGVATRIELELETTSSGGMLRISDNGTGIALTRSESTGMGVSIMCYRAHLIGGDLAIAPSEDGGTQVTCTFEQSAAALEYEQAA